MSMCLIKGKVFCKKGSVPPEDVQEQGLKEGSSERGTHQDTELKH